MSRLIGFIAAIAFISACASELAGAARDTIESHKAAQESTLSRIANG